MTLGSYKDLYICKSLRLDLVGTRVCTFNDLDASPISRERRMRPV